MRGDPYGYAARQSRRQGPPCACGCGVRTTNADFPYVRGHRPLLSLEDRFWPKVDQADGCWEWTASTTSTGYGLIVLPGNKHLMAHRASWIINRGEITDGLWVLHHCDNKLCVNPEHLYLGTHADNVRDAIERQRYVNTRARGERNSNAKLTDEQVAEIRRRHRRNMHPARRTGSSSSELAAEFGVTKQYVGQLAAGVWRKDVA